MRGLFKGAGRILVVAAAVAVASYAACLGTAGWSDWLQLLLAVLAGGAAYALLLLLPPFRRDVRGVLEVARQGMRR